VAYTYDITTNRGKVRANLGDNTASTGATAGFLFDDDEIDALLSEGSTVTGATVVGLRRLIAHKALRTKAFTLQGISLNDSEGLRYLRELIAMYGGQMPSLSITSPAPLPMDDAFDIDSP